MKFPPVKKVANEIKRKKYDFCQSGIVVLYMQRDGCWMLRAEMTEGMGASGFTSGVPIDAASNCRKLASDLVDGIREEYQLCRSGGLQ